MADPTTVITVDAGSLITAAGTIAAGITAGMGLIGKIAANYLAARDKAADTRLGGTIEAMGKLETRVGELIVTVQKGQDEARNSERSMTDKLLTALTSNAAANASNTAALQTLTTEIQKSRSVGS